MKKSTVPDHACPNPLCLMFRKYGQGNVRCHCFYVTSQGRLRRFLCISCDKTFSSTAGTPYYRLRKSRRCFDDVAAMSVEGISKSAISRLQRLAWNTVAKWLELAAKFAKRFNQRMIRGFELVELQADEICTFIQKKRDQFWLFTTLEVWSRLWVSFVAGRRSYRNARMVLSDTIERARIEGRILFTTDGFEPYAWAAKKLLGGICLYGQVIKERHNNRVTKVERRLMAGTKSQLAEALVNSEDSTTMNTSFVERHNLTIRQGSAYLCRRSICFARYPEYFEYQMELMRCHYNFIRPHLGLKFAEEVRTPGMQAGLVKRRLSFREIFLSRVAFFLFFISWIELKRIVAAFGRPGYQHSTVT